LEVGELVRAQVALNRSPSDQWAPPKACSNGPSSTWGCLGNAGSSQVIQKNEDNPEEVGTALGSTIAKDAFTLLDADYAPCLNVCSNGVWTMRICF